jgi:hypothetical protein
MNKPYTDLGSIVAIEDASSFENVNILEDWPDMTTTGLDKSQSTALKRVLTKRLAIIQGPPGTGKRGFKGVTQQYNNGRSPRYCYMSYKPCTRSVI